MIFAYLEYQSHAIMEHAKFFTSVVNMDKFKASKLLLILVIFCLKGKQRNYFTGINVFGIFYDVKIREVVTKILLLNSFFFKSSRNVMAIMIHINIYNTLLFLNLKGYTLLA